MLFLRSWLEEYIDLSGYTNSQLGNLISLRSAEVEEIKEVDDYFDQKVVIGQIENLRKHPNADKLQIFDVNLGSSKVQIVSAAPNVVEGLICPVALVGSRLGYLTIGPRQMRGENSQGMCLGKSELMLETEFSSGLWELNDILSQKNLQPNDYLGESVCTILPEYFAKQTLFDIKYLADKFAVCSSHLGLAFELALVLEDLSLLKNTARKLLQPKSNILEKIAKDTDLKIDFDDKTGYTDNFNLFSLNLDKEFILPCELQLKMFLTEKNLVGNLADLSNYLLFDLGQPSHFFSKQKLIDLNEGDKHLDWKIKSLEKETDFEGLGKLKKSALPMDTIVIEQRDKILAVPAITGSSATKTEPNETEMVLEVANFDSQKVARNSFKMGYRSDAARFFSAGIRPSLIEIFVEHMVDILNQYKIKFELKNLNLWQRGTLDPVKIELNYDYLSSRLDARGLDFWQTEIKTKLKLLGKIENNSFYPNIFYSNIFSQEDVLFELARLIGFENLQPQYFNFSSKQNYNPKFESIYQIKKMLTSYGFFEIISRPFLKKTELLSSLSKTVPVSLKAISSQRSGEDFLQDSLFSNLLKVLSLNLKKGEKNLKIFELNKIYTQQNRLIETMCLDLVFVESTPYAATSFLMELSKKINKNLEITPNSKMTEIGKGFSYDCEFFRADLIELKNTVKKQFDIPLGKKVWYASLNISKLPYFSDYKKYNDQSDFPNIQRSYSLFVPEDLSWQKFTKYIEKYQLKDCLIQVSPKERLAIDENKKNILNFALEFVSYSRTLESKEIANWEQQLFTDLKKDYSVEIR